MSNMLTARNLRRALPVLAVTMILLPTFYIQPRTMSYFGLNLLLNLAVPLAFATLSQMFIITVNDIDLSTGAFVSLVACISVRIFPKSIALGVGILLVCIIVYGLMGALIHMRNLPSIMVTLGMSFIWLGCSLLILPRPGGSAPDWLMTVANYQPPFIPLPIIVSLTIALIVHFGLMKSAYGAILRGIGGNATAVARSGWSILRAKIIAYGLAGLFGVLAGILLAGITTSADANIAGRYTLFSIAGVILGGGDFVGGRVSPIGAVLGAITLMLAGSFLSFIKVSTDWQIGAQGIILIIVLAGRVITTRQEKQI
jgi:ribose transport system permease protein